MSGANVNVNRIKGTSTLVRPKFGPGMLLHHDDLDRLSIYTRELSSLMFRSLFGCGVICGLVVKPGEDDCGQPCITVGAGVGLGCSGHPIYLPKDQSLVIDEDCNPDLEGPLWVVLCGNVKSCAPRPSACADEDETTSAHTQEREGYEIRIVKERPKCACGCKDPEPNEPYPAFISSCKCVDPEHECFKDHYAGLCDCDCDDCSLGSCECVILARLDKKTDPEGWTVDHRVRRFIRPVLMRDPQVELEKPKTNGGGNGNLQAPASAAAAAKVAKGKKTVITP
jgi:hypothetical protein